RETPADGVITGIGRIDGRDVLCAAYDFTVLAGSIGMVGETKVARLRELALRERRPIVWLIDSAGARIQEAASSIFAGTGHLFKEQVVLSGVVPQVAALVGPGAAGTAYIPGLADVVFMVKGIGSMALGGPPLVKAAIGEDVTEEDLGGSKVHCYKSGVGHVEVPDDATCMAKIREYLSFFPSHCKEKPPRAACSDPVDRREEGLLDIVPDQSRKPFDMMKVIEKVVDDGKMFPIQPFWARSIVTVLARIGGRPVGIVGSQPAYLGGVLDVDSADKAAHFVNLCDSFNVPLVFLLDVPGFMIGSKVEAQGIIRHGAKMLYQVASATVPKLTVVVRKAYGAGYYVMNGRAYEPDLIVGWPTGEVSLMGAEGAVNIIFRKQIDAAEDKEATRKALVEQYRAMIDPYIPAHWAMVDDIIDPRDTRYLLHRGLELTVDKTVERPWRKQGVVPV
ncbi:MAG TPA: acyl-CoA carboxylase subunit beta, partial [Planctomycetota bacterium]|nr:acyl-CoA carboxylase subunit beta [Planctomycetota bacterium]